MSAPKKKTGRPTKFNDRLLEKVVALAKDGKTNEEIAEIIGVNPATIYVWQAKHKTFYEALKGAKGIADDMVEASLFRRAVGYSHKAVKIFYNAKMDEVTEHHYIEHYPPDTVAAIFWLKNRRPDDWREKTDIAIEDNVNLNLKIGHEDEIDSSESDPDASTADPATKADSGIDG